MAATRVLCFIACIITIPALGTTVLLQAFTGRDTPSSSCNFSLAMRDPGITGWELELLPPLGMLLVPGDAHRSAALTKINGILETTGRKHGLQYEPSSLRTSVSSQISRSLSTVDGRSLVNSSVTYPWKGPAFLRLREKLATYKGSNGAPVSYGVPPGSADLTLKIKDVNPRHIPKGLMLADSDNELMAKAKSESKRPYLNHHQGLALAHSEGGPSATPDEDRKKPHLKVKVENDVYCSYANRAIYEAKWSPVPSDTNLTTLSGVSSFFRHAPRQLGLPPDMRLPIYARREFSKSVWDMRVAGVRGVVNLVLIFADQRSSLAGESPVKAELSFRLKQEDLEEVYEPGSKHYYDSLDALIDLCNDLHDKGWDEDPDTAAKALLPA